jgi:hypothetical protein
MQKEGGLTGRYYDYALAAPVLNGRAAPKVLVLGMGTGTFATQCREYFPGTAVEGVEIDGKITDLAHTYFRLAPDVPVTTYDGRAFLNVLRRDLRRDPGGRLSGHHDPLPDELHGILYAGAGTPPRLGGVMVVNMNMHSDAPRQHQ